MNQSFFVLFVLGICIALLAVMIWGWVRWAKHREPRTAFSTLSLVGFILATASGLLAISAMLYARAGGGFLFYDPSLVRIYRLGVILSLAAMAFAIVGLWRPSPLRWHAPLCAVGTLVFWLAAAGSE
jgi:heme/copper-type cytochrome/quinol oxidase subunit 1